MRALILEDYGQLSVRNIDVPWPATDEALVRIIATGICGSDIHGFTGENGRRHPGQVMGHETVGRVESLPSGVESPAVGCLVTINPVILSDASRRRYAGNEQHAPDKIVLGVEPNKIAAFAELIAVPVVNLVPLELTDPQLGALVEPLAVALHAVRRLGTVEGRTVLVMGGGPIGQCILIAAGWEGARKVLVGELDAPRRRLSESLGAETFDPRVESAEQAVVRVFDGPADGALDAVGIGETIESALTAVRPGGAVCLVGMGAKEIAMSAFAISTEERSIIGSFTYSSQDFEDAARLATSDPSILGRLVSSTVTMDAAPEAFEQLARGRGVPGKILVLLGPSSEEIGDGGE